MSERRLPILPERLLPFLPEDLITENILVRLPVKSVGRFRCVSKPWRSLLSSPKFARAHLKIHSDHDPEGSILVSFFPNFAFCTLNFRNESRMVSRTTRSLALPSYEGSMRGELQGSCHGLVLVKQKGSLDFFNPITRETLKIPEFCGSSYDLGLGYDSIKYDYKIVCLTADEPRTVGIYSLKLRTWRNVGNMPYQHFEDGGLFVNGCLHWPAWAPHGFVLAAFCLALEEFKELPPPKGVVERILWCSKLTILGGCLALIFKDAGVMDIWVMKEYGVQDSWTKYSLNISMSGWLRVVGVMGEDEIVLVEGGYEELLASNWKTGVSRNLFHAGIPCINIDGIACFRESLISPIIR